MSTGTDGGVKNAWAQWFSALGNTAQGVGGPGGAAGPVANLYKEWEAFFGTQFEKLARSETFLGQMAKTLEGSFLLKSQFDRMMEHSVRAMRMPTASDMELVNQRLDGLERRLDALMEKLDARTPPKGRPAPSAPVAPGAKE